jgi:hypothetical protein
MKILAFVGLIWAVAFVAHMLRETWVITYSLDALPKCRRLWCPEGIKNRWKP